MLLDGQTAFPELRLADEGVDEHRFVLLVVHPLRSLEGVRNVVPSSHFHPLGPEPFHHFVILRKLQKIKNK